MKKIHGPSAWGCPHVPCRPREFRAALSEAGTERGFHPVQGHSSGHSRVSSAAQCLQIVALMQVPSYVTDGS